MVMRVLRLTSQRCVQGFSDDPVDEQEPEARHLQMRHACTQGCPWQSHHVADKHKGAAQRVLLAEPVKVSQQRKCESKNLPR